MELTHEAVKVKSSNGLGEICTTKHKSMGKSHAYTPALDNT